MIRNINRQIEQHLRTFGEGSREYQDLIRNIESEIGRPQYNKDGRPYYSRSAGRQYDMQSLQNAAESVKGAGTAFSKAQPYINDLLQQGIEPTDANIREAASIEEEVSQNFDAVYEFLQNEEPDFDNSDVRMEFAGNQGSAGSRQDLVDILNRVTAKQGYSSIQDVINAAKAFKESRNDGIKEQARQTRRTARMTPKEIEQRMKLQPEEKPRRMKQNRTKVDDRRSKVYGKQPKLNRGTKKDKGVKK